jgi:hypothetical protein
MQLGLKRMTLKTKAVRTRGNGLRMKALNATARAPRSIRRARTRRSRSRTSRVSSSARPSRRSTGRRRGKTFRFRDKKRAFAGGLKKGRFKMKKNGQIVFKTSGRKMTLRAPSKPRVDITLRVGGACWQAPATLRKKRTILTTP